MTFVCQWYRPEPALQADWIVGALVDRGVDVRVLTGMPNYPTGRLHPDYRGPRARWRRRETRDGVVLLRTPLVPSHDRSAVGRIANYLSWAVSATVLGRPALRDADVALVYSSPATAALPAMVARRLRGTPYVLWVQDVWPDSVTASGFLTARRLRPLVRLLEVMVRRTYAEASAVVVSSPGMVDLLASRGVPRDRLTLVHNWVRGVAPDRTAPSAGHASGTAPGELRSLVGPDAFTLLYAGNHGAAQDLGPVVRAVLACPPGEAEVHLVMVGDGVERAALEALAAGSPRVHLLGTRTPAEVAAMAAEADAQVVSLADRPLFAVTTPSKLQAVLAAGRPVLAHAAGDVARVVEESGAGVVARPGAPRVLEQAIERLRRMPVAEREAMGRRGREHYRSVMAEDVGAATLVRTLEDAAGVRHRDATGVGA